MAQPGLKKRVLELDQIPAKGGLRGSFFEDAIHYLRHHPDQAEVVLEKLGPHIPGLGLKAFGQLAHTLYQVRNDMRNQILELVQPGDRAVDYLNKISDIGDVVQMYFLSRQHLACIGNHQQVQEYDQASARRALIRAMSLPLETDLLEAMLDMPDGLEHKVRVRDFVGDWVAGMAAQVCAQPITSTRTAAVLDVMIGYGVQIQHDDKTCPGLSYLAKHHDPAQTVNRISLAINLLDRGANFLGAGLEQTNMWQKLKDHPGVKARKLEEIVAKVRGEEHDVPRAVRLSKPGM